MSSGTCEGLRARIGIKKLPSSNSASNIGTPRPQEDLREMVPSSSGELEQIQFLLGHASVQKTARYIGCKQELSRAVNDRLPLTGRAGLMPRYACRYREGGFPDTNQRGGRSRDSLHLLTLDVFECASDVQVSVEMIAPLIVDPDEM
jgi:hypothetical protein